MFVGSLTAGGIWRGDVRTGQGAVIPGTEGTLGVGMEYEAAANRLWVAGGGSGQVHVFDASSGELLQTYTFSPAGFLNDLVVTDSAVYVTNSSFAWLDVIPINSDGSLADPADAFMLPVSGDFTLAPGFNLNGIVTARGWLIGVQSNTGTLFRIDPSTGDATEIALGTGVNVINGDGLEVHGRTLYVVQNQNNRVEVFALGPGLASATLQRTLTGALDIPTTIAWVADATYVVNARFNTPPTPTRRTRSPASGRSAANRRQSAPSFASPGSLGPGRRRSCQSRSIPATRIKNSSRFSPGCDARRRLAEQVELARDQRVLDRRLAPRRVGAADDRGGPGGRLAERELGGRRDLVGDGPDGRAHDPAVVVGDAAEVLERQHPGDPDRDVDDAPAPRPAERVADDDRDVDAEPLADRGSMPAPTRPGRAAGASRPGRSPARRSRRRCRRWRRRTRGGSR